MTDAPPPVEVAMLRSFLAGRDVSCPGCGYNVRDLPTDLCPECGQHLRLTVSLAEPKQAALIAGLVALSAGAGFGGLLLVYAVIQTVVRDQSFGGFLSRFIAVNAIGFAVHSAAVTVWIWKWRRIRRLSGLKRGSLVAACATLPLAFVVVFSFTIR